jgi:hypothetical protein
LSFGVSDDHHSAPQNPPSATLGTAHVVALAADGGAAKVRMTVSRSPDRVEFICLMSRLEQLGAVPGNDPGVMTSAGAS